VLSWSNVLLWDIGRWTLVLKLQLGMADGCMLDSLTAGQVCRLGWHWSRYLRGKLLDLEVVEAPGISGSYYRLATCNPQLSSEWGRDIQLSAPTSTICR